MNYSDLSAFYLCFENQKLTSLMYFIVGVKTITLPMKELPDLGDKFTILPCFDSSNHWNGSYKLKFQKTEAVEAMWANIIGIIAEQRI